MINLSCKIDRKKLIWISWLLVMLWMVFIFCMSGQASQESGEVSIEMLRLIRGTFSISVTQFIVRKMAHIFEYFVLSLLFQHALYRSGVKRYCFTAVGMSVLYAATDEFHQRFIPGRTGRPIDVAIDMIGILSAVLMVCIVKFLMKKTKRFKKDASK